MKLFYSLIPPVIKAFFGVVVFMVSLGWGALFTIKTLIDDSVAQAEARIEKLQDVKVAEIHSRLNRIETLQIKTLEIVSGQNKEDLSGKN